MSEPGHRSFVFAAQPAWLAVAVERCQTEAAELERRTAALQALPREAPTGQFIDLYEKMLWARDRLYEAWIATELDGQ